MTTLAAETTIVASDRPVLLLGGGRIVDEDLTEARSLAPRVVAADGGGDRALAAGLTPEAVIGDLDSLSEAGRRALAGVLHQIAEQETTDFDKALRSIAAPVVIALGMLGGRFDHTLAACTVLCRLPHRACVVVGAENVMALCPPDLSLDLDAGTDLSLYPMGEVTCASEGLVWPTDGLLLSPLHRVATSNRVAGPVRLRPSAPRLLLILPRICLSALVTRLAALPQPARWPAPAR